MEEYADQTADIEYLCHESQFLSCTATENNFKPPALIAYPLCQKTSANSSNTRSHQYCVGWFWLAPRLESKTYLARS